MHTIAMHILEAGVPMQTDTIASERFWASLLEMLPLATRKLPALYLSPFRRQSSTYVVWEGMSDALSGCSHSFRTWIHPRREYLCRISLRRLSLRNAACVRCATSLISVSVCMSVWLHVGLYVYVCVCVHASVFLLGLYEPVLVHGQCVPDGALKTNAGHLGDDGHNQCL